MYDVHTPVLLEESIQFLITDPSGNYFDGTLGFGGHSTEFLNRLNTNGKVIGTDKDENAFNYCMKKFESDKRMSIYRASFTEIRTISKIEFIDIFDGIFADLGVSSYQLDDKKSGFTYRENVQLDMRMDKSSGIPAAVILNEFSEKEIADIIYKYGEEKKSRQIARKIVETRSQKRFSTTGQLVQLLEGMTPPNFVKKTLSRVFQALRIYVNNELGELEQFNDTATPLLKSGGRIGIISFHSLEDRIVKEKFKYETLDCICPPESPVCVCDKEQRLKLITKKPLVPNAEEVKSNFRARSAKLRVAERI